MRASLDRNGVLRKLNWKPGLPNKQTPQFAIDPAVQATLPVAVDNSKWCPPIWDQGQEGSCVDHGVVRNAIFDKIRQGGHHPTMWSRNFTYWNARALEGDTRQDGGSTVLDGILALHKYGACPESMWPYGPHTLFTKPPASCYAAADKTLMTMHMAVPQDLSSMLNCLAQGFGICIGFTVYSSFMRIGSDGTMPYPDVSKETIEGGHCMFVHSYDINKQIFTADNSWGTSFGDNGRVHMPFAVLTDPNMSSDFHSIRWVP